MESFGPSKRLALRRPDLCARCGRKFDIGESALWYREVRLVTCLECPESLGATSATHAAPASTEAVDAGVAGASSRREYERRRQKREDFARAKLGKVGVALARVIDEPQSTAAWQKGARGESAVAKSLQKHLAGTDVRLLHDRRIPGGRTNIDHIAVGPGGITVIDTKNYKGKVRLQRVGGLFSERRTILEVGGRDQTRLITGVETQIGAVRAALASTEFAAIDIAGALCFANVDGLPMFAHQELRNITIDGARRVAKLAARPGDQTQDGVTRLWRLLAESFSPA